MRSSPDEQIPMTCDAIKEAVGLSAFDALSDSPKGLVNLLKSYLDNRQG